MSFSAADLVATIRLDGAEKVGRDLGAVRSELTKTDSAVSKVASGARAAFDGAATGIGTATVAATVFTAKLLSTGIAYNQLQQTSRAALRTLLGGAEAANVQMDKLDAFAKTSPFSKSVFISAQQQLIGFGFEAQKVIPILNSVQNAVAAVGGSNQQISDIVSILAKIRSSGKLTAEDLNMLGERGLDAATLMGAGFGKTAAEIRESITKGTLDAGEAVDVLVAQMDAKFSGAANNVKDTFAGTTDRIKAASRDIGAALAEPFVSRNGGGLAVVWGNQVADVLRAVESQVPSVVALLMSEGAPALAEVTGLLDRARVQVRSWDSSRIERGLEVIGQNGPAIAAVAGAILGVNTNILRGIPVLGQFVPAISPLAGILGGIALASPEVRGELGALLGTLQPLVPVLVEIAGVASGGLNVALPVVADGIRVVTAVASPFVDILESIPAPILAAVAGAVALAVGLNSSRPAIQGFVDGIRTIADQIAVQAALAAMEGNTSRLAGTMGYAGTKVTGLANSLKAAFITNPVGLIILGLSTAAAILTAAFTAQAEAAQENREKIDEYRNTLDQTTGSVLRATRAEVEKTLADKGAFEAAEKLGLSRQTLIDAVFGEETALRDVADAYREYAGTVQKDGITQAKQFNTEAGIVNNTVLTQRELIEEAQEAFRRDAEAKREAARAMDEAERSNSRLNEALAIARDVGRDATERLKALKQALDELDGGAKTAAEATRDLNEQNDKLREVFMAVDDAGNRLATGLINSAGAIDTTSAAGRTLFDEVNRLNDQMLDAILLADKDAKARGDQGVSMEEAREIASRYQDSLRGIASEAGLSEEQVNGLIGTMLETPEVVAFAVSDDGTIDAEKLRLIDLASQILATPDKQFDITNVSIPGLMDALRTLGYTVETLPDGVISVTKDGQSFDAVAGALTALVSETRTARIQAWVDLGPARYQLQQFAGSASVPGMGTVRRAFAGPIFGPGTSTSDSILVRASNDEHMLSAAEVRGMGGHAEVARIRAEARAGRFGLPAFRYGGPIRFAVNDAVLPQAAPIAIRSSGSAVAQSASADLGRLLERLEQMLRGPMVSFDGAQFFSYDPHEVGREAGEQLTRVLDAHGM